MGGGGGCCWGGGVRGSYLQDGVFGGRPGGDDLAVQPPAAVGVDHVSLDDQVLQHVLGHSPRCPAGGVRSGRRGPASGQQQGGEPESEEPSNASHFLGSLVVRVLPPPTPRHPPAHVHSLPVGVLEQDDPYLRI